MRNTINNNGYTGGSQSKKIVLIIIIVLIALILLGGGIFAYAYFFTDMLLTEEQGFYKYIAKNSEIIEIFKDKDLDKYSEKIQKDAYSNNGELSVALTGDIDEETKKITDEIQKHKITLNGSVDSANKYFYQELKLIYGESDVISGTLINKNDYLGLKVNDIGLNPYIVFENNNLKQFAKNMGLLEDEIAIIPDKIDWEKLQNQEIFTEDELKQLKDRYLKAITDNLTEDMFSKKEENELDIYTLTVNEEKAKNILSSLIDTLKNDEMLLNKIKQIYIEQYNITEEEAQTFIDEFKEALDEAKNELNGTSSSEYGDSLSIQEENTQSEDLYINVYVSNRSLIKTEIVVEEGKIILTSSNNKVTLEIAEQELQQQKESTANSYLIGPTQNEESESQFTENIYKTTASVSVEKNKTDNELSYKFIIMEEDNEEIAKATITFTGLAGMTNVAENFIVDMYVRDSSDDILNQAQNSLNNTTNAMEKEAVSIVLAQLSTKVYQDSYISGNEFVLNETTIKQALVQQNLDMTVSRNEDGTYRLQSNSTGNIYTVNSQCQLTNTEFASDEKNTVEPEEKVITISLDYNGTTTFGAIQQQELTESDMYIINNKSLEQLQSLFNQLENRVLNKISNAYSNTVIGQMITQQ